MDNLNMELAMQFKKAAAELRHKAKEMKKKQTVKCAQVLTAVRGLSQLQRILRGAEK